MRLALVLSCCLALAATQTQAPRVTVASSDGTTELVSISSSGLQGNGDSGDPVAVTDDGRCVGFNSSADNLVAGDSNGAVDTFIRDRVAGVTERVDVSTDGTEANNGSEYPPSLSSDCRYVSFTSAATNLSPVPLSAIPQVYVRDRVNETTELVSVGMDGSPANDSSFGFRSRSMSADSRYIVFTSYATNLVPGLAGPSEQVYMRDRVAQTTVRVSVNSFGAAANGDSGWPQVSSDGRFVAFESLASNLDPRNSGNETNVFLHDNLTDVTELASTDYMGVDEANGSSYSGYTSDDGRFVTFDSFATNVVADDTNGVSDVFIHDMLTGTTEMISVADSSGLLGGGAGGEAGSPVSGDGRFVAFEASDPQSKNLNVFVRDRVTATTELISEAIGGGPGNGASLWPSMSADGRYVAYLSGASNLVPGDSNGAEDVFLRERCPDGTCAVSTPVLDPAKSTISVNPTSLVANCAAAHATATLTLLDTNGNTYTQPMTVTLSSSRSGADTITGSPVTTSTGTATFTVCSGTPGTATLSAGVNGQTLTSTASVTFTHRYVVFVRGINSQLTSSQLAAMAADCASSADTDFHDVKAALLSLGYSCRDFLDFSYTFGSFDSNDNWLPNPYSCADTGQHIGASYPGSGAQDLNAMLFDFAQKHPGAAFTVIGHSAGGLIAFDQLQGMQSGNLLFKPRIDQVVTLDSPLRGAPLSGLADYIVRLGIGRQRCPSDYKLWAESDAILEIAGLAQINIEPFNEGYVTQARLEGTRVTTLGNWDDCVYDQTDCLGRSTPYPDRAVTQVINNARLDGVAMGVPKMYDLCPQNNRRICGNFLNDPGHVDILHDKPAQIASFVGPPD